ncbi:hypothetical protein Taro_030357 [Colocasia esculenta]|uniref:Uncharacterized protein n=1 Tax=Colocasia esculenta TaxID=4460 RepID=A0A843VNX0_COLES|nr:hypothetical protein [Colocasia esculenta]
MKSRALRDNPNIDHILALRSSQKSVCRQPTCCCGQVLTGGSEITPRDSYIHPSCSEDTLLKN